MKRSLILSVLFLTLLVGQRAAAQSGALDPGFGTGGKVTSFFNASDDGARAIALQSDGKKVVAGYSRISGHFQFAAARYTAAGALDATFGTGGIATAAVGTEQDWGNAVAIQSDGKIVVAGRSNLPAYAGNVIGLVRFNTNGTLDNSFGGDGIVTTNINGSEEAKAVAIQSDGKIVVTGSTWVSASNSEFLTLRYTSTGDLDNSFGTNGNVQTNLHVPSFANSADGFSVTATDGTDLFVAYTAYDTTVWDYVPVVKKLSGSTWSDVGSHPYDSSVTALDFAINTVGENQTSYLAVAGTAMNGGGAKVLVSDGGAWITLGNANFTANQVRDLSLAFDADTVYVAYIDEADGDNVTVKKFDGSAWVIVGSEDLAADGAEEVSLAIQSGIPVVAYAEGSSRNNYNNLTVKQFNGATWELIGTSKFVSGYAAFISLALDPGGVPYVSYADYDGAQRTTVVKWNAGTTSWDFVGGANFSEFYVLSTTLKFVGSVPYVAYLESDDSGGYLPTVKYFNGSSWVNYGSPRFKRGSGNNPGVSFSFVNSFPYLSFSGSDADNNTVVVTKFAADWEYVGDSFDAANAIALQSDGKIVVAGRAAVQFAAARYNTDGTLDASLKFPVGVTGENLYAYPNSIAVRPNGKIVLAGTAWNSNDQDFAVVQVLGDLSGLDQFFGTSGITTTDVNGTDEGYGVALQADGKIVVAGSSNNDAAVAVLRYTSSGALDPDFDSDGKVGLTFGAGYNTGRAVALTSDSRIVVAGIAEQTGIYGFGLAQFQNTLDTTAWYSLGAADFAASPSHPQIFMSGITPYVAYVDYAVTSPTSRVSVMAFNGTSWNFVDAQGSASGSDAVGDMGFTVIGGTPYVAYRDNGNSQKLTVRKYDGSSWVLVGAAGFTSTAVYGNMKMAGNGTDPYVLYTTDEAISHVYVTKFNGTSWETIGGGPVVAGAAGNNEMEIAGSTIYVSLRTSPNYFLSVLKFNGTSWEYVGAPEFSGVATSYYTAMAVSGLTPYVLYKESGISNKPLVKKFDGTNWVTVGSGAIGTIDMVGEVPAMTVLNDVPYVMYKTQLGNYQMFIKKLASNNTWIDVGSSPFFSGSWCVPGGLVTTPGGMLLAGYTTNVGLNVKKYSITSAPEALPVEMVGFAAAASRNGVELSWSTAAEVNNRGFEIERKSLAGWSEIGFVNGAGTSNTIRAYSFTDLQVAAGRYSYRIKQVDQNGAFKYSGSVEVVVGTLPHELTLSQNYPNPFNPTTNIEFTLANDGPVTLKVFNVLGQEVASLINQDLKAGLLHKATFNAANLSSGLYFYKLQADGKSMVKRLTLLK